jgi:hypothetical protein
MLGYSFILTLSVAVIAPDSSRLNLPWKQYLERSIPEEQALAIGIPEAPVRLLEAMFLLEKGNIRAARDTLRPIDTAEYRNLTIEKLTELY